MEKARTPVATKAICIMSATLADGGWHTLHVDVTVINSGEAFTASSGHGMIHRDEEG